jgi:hypothetical protein
VARIHVLEKEKCVQCFDGGTGRCNGLEDLHVVGGMILKLVLKKKDRKTLAELIWRLVRISGGFL